MSGTSQEITNLSAQEKRALLAELLKKSKRPRMFPTSFAQQRLWFLQQLEPESTAYNLPLAVRLSGDLDRTALQRSLSEIVRRHEALRTTFATVDGEPVQVIHPAVEVWLPLIDLSALPAEEREREAERLSVEEAGHVFSLERGPLLRARLVKLREQEHVALFTMHHIVSDGWSMGVLIKEVGTLYSSYVAGEESALEELSIQYADYAAWQRDWLQGDVLEAELRYWREQLADAPAVLELPTDRPRPATPSHRGARHSLALSTELTASLKELSRREGVTMFMLLLAGFQVLLSRSSGQEEIVVGSPIANRNRSETEGLIGFFVNTLALRTTLLPTSTFRQLLQQVREVCLGGYAHQDVPFEKLVEELEPERSLSHTPLFQVMMVLQNAPQGSLELPGLELRGFGREGHTAKFDLTLSMMETADGVNGSFEYNTDLFEAATIERMAAHFQTLLTSIVSNPAQRISELEMLSEAERQQLLVEFNDTHCEYPQDICLHQLFEQQVERSPDALALTFDDEHLTYAQLNARANQLAHYLQSHGIGVEDRVGVLLERSVEMVVSLLAILKAGAAYVPLDPAYPQERLAFTLADSTASLLLSRSSLLDSLSLALPDSLPLLALDRSDTEIASHSRDNLTSPVLAENLAYLIYTSGSTGTPKGVAITHHSASTLIHWSADIYSPSQLSGVLASTSICFDLSVWELFVPLALGGRVLLAHNALELPTLAARDEVRLINTVPSAMAELVRQRAIPRSVEVINLAGEALSERLVREIYEQSAEVEVNNLYGPSEDTTYSTWQQVRLGERVTIGRPVANTQVYILDGELKLVGVGVRGEVYIGGEGLARGYLNRAELTAERFIPHPFSTTPGARLYRTGDVGRYRADGEIEYLGRTDHQVKVRGFRIELGEIESVLCQHEQVREAVVVAQEATTGQQRLVAYVVAEDGGELQTSEMRKHLAEKLPEHMIPSVFVELAELPLTPNGKVDRRALPAPDASRLTQENAFVAPRTPIEELTASIWQQVLGLEQVGIHDNFFELGGHSLLATQVVSRLRQTFSVELALRTLFESPTVEALAERINAASSHTLTLAAPALQPVSRQERLPLSFAQQRLWFLQQLEPESTAYNLPLAVRLSGDLDRTALQHSLSEIVRRHEALRTTFATADGEPVQVIHPAVEVWLPLIDLSCLPADEREREAERLSVEEAGHVFSLERGPLLRARLVKLGEPEHVVLLTMHHIVSDGWSMGVLIKEVASLYAAYSRGGESELEELGIQYADYAAWQRDWLQGDVLDAELRYWREQLADAPAVLELPTDRPRPATPSHRGARQTFVVPTGLTASLKELSRREGVTMFMLLLAGFQVLLSRSSGQEEIVVGSPIANRNRSETEGLIGFFVNTLALRTRVAAEASFSEVLGRVREVCLGGYAHQDVPFEKLVEELEPERSLSHTPLFQVMMVLQNAPQGSLELPGLELRGFGREGHTTKFDLTLSMVEGTSGLSGTLSYRTDLFDAATIERMAAHFQTLLAGIVADPRQRVADLPLLTAEERQQILIEWNETARDYARESCVQELFEEQVERTPEGLAVACEESQLSFAELNGRANQLARYLRKLGVGPEARVGILLERSVEMIVALFGILKAGGAYVPLDPTNPRERLTFMLADAGAKILLTQQRFVGQMPEDAFKAVCLDVEWETITRESDANLKTKVDAENLAYVIYTSGSTGQPKGAMIRHSAVINLTTALKHAIYDDQPSPLRVSLNAPLAFDASVKQVVQLLSGHCLDIVPEDLRRDGGALLSHLKARGVAAIDATPTQLRMLMSEGLEDAANSPLSLALVGGEALDEPLWKAMGESRRTSYYNVYGPTECTVDATACEVTGSLSVPTIGRPLSNITVYVLDKRLQPVPVGVTGELHIGGAGLARGYHERPDLTAEKFIPHPYADEPGARLYRTGDLARYLADGQIEYVGRLDHQLKVRGFRIEAGEVEAALAGHERVRECLVVTSADATGQARLVAYMVADAAAEQTPSRSELQAYLKERLPEYMIPSVFVWLLEMPLTRNGKIDRNALPAPDGQDDAHEKSSAVARTPIEEMLVGIWSQVLGVEQVGVQSNFFELGGHSLLAMQLVSRMRSAFRVEIPMRALFESPTIAELSEKIETALREGTGIQTMPVERVSRDVELPLSFAQQRLWFIEQFDPDNSLYNMPFAVRLTGQLDVWALEQTFTEIVRRHEVLRTSIHEFDGRAVQSIAPPQSMLLPLIDLSAYDEAARETEAHRLASEEAQQHFDLTQGPLLRANLLRVGEQEHILLFTMHHIASDGWSMGVLIKEVTALYEAFSQHLPTPLEELTIQYADFAYWQRQWLQGEVLEKQLAYWTQQLSGAPTLELPTDKLRPAIQSHRGATHGLALSPELSQKLKQLSGREGASLFMTLLAGFQTLLYRYTGQTDITVGTPLAGRNRGELEQLIGFFVNTLALRTTLLPTSTFRQLLQQVREVCLGGYAHQDVPFEKLVEELEPERSLSHTPLFQVMMVLQNAPQGSLELPGLELRGFGREGHTAKFDLLLAMAERDGQLACSFEYSTDLFEAATIERMAIHFQTLLESIVADPQQRISELKLLSATERQQLLVQWNDTSTAYPQDICLPELFEQQVERSPDALAFVSDDEHLTYADLNRRANQLAHYLQSHGIGLEDRVGVLLERSVEMVVALLAILKAGAAYVPLDPAYPQERLAFMAVDAHLSLLLTKTEFAAPASVVRQVCLDVESQAIAAHTCDNLTSQTVAENLAYLIYTSGSTGLPKGVAIPHRAVTRLVCQTNYIRFLASDGVAYAANASFDAAIWEVWGALLHGARLVLIRQEVVLSPPELAVQLAADRVSVMFLTTSLFNQVALSEPQAFGALRCVMFGGEAADARSVRAVLAHGAPKQLLNGYGPTENTTFSTWYEVREVGESERTLPIGRPIGNSQAYVLDRELEPVAVGVRGELYVGGDGLARHYQNRGELTAERFIPHPFSATPGARLYRTGDLARYLGDGKLEYLGRADQQVKVRGYRIELGEIEAVLSQHEQVREAIVVAAERGEGGEKQLVGYVVVEDGAALQTSELRRHLGEKLPEQMIPSIFVQLTELPLTPNGKVDRRALPSPDISQQRGTDAYVAPRTPIEELTASIWQQVLGLEQVSIHDNFFELGGHSLLATQVVSRLRQTFSVELPLRALFESPTVEALAERISAASQHSDLYPVPALQPVSREQSLPLSFAQQRLWFLQQLEPESTAYNLPLAVRLSGDLDRTALQRSLSEIVRRHEALRTTFATADGEPVQVIHPAVEVSLPLIDLSRLPADEREREAERLSVEEAGHVFSLERGPLLRARLIKQREDEHIVLLTMHHIVSDGWSMGVLIKEVASLYAAYSRGGESELEELGIQYADYAAWQRDWLQGDVLEAELRYWREQLADAPAVLELPTDRPRPATPSHRGARHSLALSTELTASLRELSQREGVTMFMLLLAGFQVLLSRSSGQEEIVVGSPIANRNRSETEGLIGFFVNTLALRTTLLPTSTFRQLLQQVREVCLGGYAHQDVPFEKLVEELEPERSLSHTPLFQVMMVLQNAPQGSLELPGLELRGFGREGHTAKFDLTLSMAEREGEVGGTFEYSTDLFEAATIERMAAHFQTLLTSIVSNPAQRISELEMLSEAERQQLLVEFNDTQIAYPQDVCLHQLFEQQVERTPDALALTFDDEHLTYAQLNARANQLAHYLQSHGIGVENRVGLLLERSIEMVVSLLAILKAGAAYVPLDPAYPQERLAFMVEDARLSLLLTDSRLRSRVSTPATALLCLDTEWDTSSSSDSAVSDSRANLDCLVPPTALAYIIYTSGSTGLPKGVMISHHAIANHMHWMTGLWPLSTTDAVLQKTPLSFDASVWEFYAPLLTGARLVLARADGHRDPAYLVEVMAAQEVTVVQAVPTLLRALVEEAGLERCERLRRVYCGGEQLLAEVAGRVSERLGEVEVYNLYGPTEATIDASYARYKGGSGGVGGRRGVQGGSRAESSRDEQRGESVPIGRPVANTQMYILGEGLELVGVGVRGEVYIGGEGLARGYLNRAELTAERFIPNPYSTEAGARLYKTGDVARYLADGEIEYLGRADHQVKIRGFRIELGEIEAALSQHQQVREAVVVAQETMGGGGQQRLVAYVVAEDGGELQTSEMRQHLAEKLPEHMIPSVFVELAELPLTPNGKVDRRALPAPDASRLTQENAYVAPRTPIEELTASIWQQVLGLEQVGIHDNFFELGGHSLLATQVVSRLRQTFSVELALRTLFESPTVEALAERINAASSHTLTLAAPALQPVSRQERLPLSFAQQRLWFLQQLEPESTAYNLPLAVRLSGDLDRTALQHSLSEIVRRHEALRTTFATADGEPVQVIHPAVEVSLPLVDVSALAESAREREAERLSVEEAGHVFSLERGPLLRARLVKLGEQEHVVLLTMHHIVSDGWSMGVLIKEVGTLYSSYVAGEESALDELSIQYADYAAWQRDWLQGDVLEAELSYWREQLADAPAVLELPTDRPRPATPSHRGARQTFVVPTGLTASLKELSQREGVTMFMLLLAGFQVLLSRSSGQEEIVVGSPIANRNRSETEGLIGFFVNTLALRTSVGGNPRFGELLGRVREVCLGGYAHQDVPFEKLVEELEPERSLSHTPLFQVMMMLQNAPQGSLELPGLELRGFGREGQTAKFDLTLSMVETADGVNASFEYSTDLFNASTIERMAMHFQTLLTSIVSNPAQRISELEMLSEAERQQLLVEFNDTITPYPQDLCLHQLFEQQVERTPDALALSFEDEHLTYAELNARANQLAHYLQAQGISLEDRVGVLVQRSVEMVVALLGVLKAGAAYVPLDPQYPQSRLTFMLADANIKALLTQQSLLHSLPEHQARTVCLDTDWPLIAQQSVLPTNNLAVVDNLAYTIYTSGSTGLPKGVQVAHRQLVNFICSMQERPGLQPHDRLLAVTTLCFDIAALELYLPLCTGAQVIVCAREAAMDGMELRRLMQQHEVTVMQATPASWRMLIESGWSGSAGLKVLCGGEALAQELAERLRSRCAELWNMYGPTETTVWSAVAEVGVDVKQVVLGEGIANTELYIVDERMKVVPIGVRGELYIGGEGVARGYLNRPELTAERFVPHPFSASEGARLYRTGDMARRLSDGQIEFLGRADQQVKIRGFRIELGEIEAVLSQHQQVREAIVVAQETTAGQQQLVGYVVAEGVEELSTSELRRHLGEKLPEYMIPSVFVQLAELPLTPNGKVDRRALPEPALNGRGREPDYLAPRNLVELRLTQIWQEVLGHAPVGVTDNFFTLGGHSLLAVRLLAGIQEQFGRKLPLAALFQGATVEEMARLLNLEDESAHRSSLVGIQPSGSKPAFFCVHPAGGNVFCYFDLAHHLGPEQPFFGLQAQGLNGEPLQTRVEEMASRYIEELRAVQPEGPYLLGGWSVGGVIAFEMARQLEAEGQGVALLGLFDSITPDAAQASAELTETDLLFSFAQHLGLTTAFLSDSLEHLLQATADEQLGAIMEQAKAAYLLPPGIRLCDAQRLWKVFKSNVYAVRNYRPQAYAGRLTLFRAGERPLTAQEKNDPTAGWGVLATGGVEVQTMPGDHFTLLREPHVRALAEGLGAFINQLTEVQNIHEDDLFSPALFS